jgi:hypothetical protein
MPGTASAAVITGSCGSTIEGKPGDQVLIDASSLLGLPKGTIPPLDLGLISAGTKTVSQAVPLVGGLLTKLCSVTVVGVNTVAAPVETGASTVNKAVENTGKALSQAITGQPQAPAPGKPGPGAAPGNPQSPGAPGGNPAGATPIPDSNSPVLAGGFSALNFGGLPFSFTSGYSPMRDYSTIPMVNAGLYSPSPGLRYGGQVPGYAPEFGVLGQNAPQPMSGGLQNAGQAEALPGQGGGMVDGAGLPMLIAVLSLSAASAGLVRAWVLRRMAAAT